MPTSHKLQATYRVSIRTVTLFRISEVWTFRLTDDGALYLNAFDKIVERLR
jgi:hypothetical protein